jgi:hypothetical protein
MDCRQRHLEGTTKVYFQCVAVLGVSEGSSLSRKSGKLTCILTLTHSRTVLFFRVARGTPVLSQPDWPGTDCD